MAYIGQLEEADDGYVRSSDLRGFRFEGVPTPLLAHMKGIKVQPNSDIALTIMTTYAAKLEDRPLRGRSRS
jgi:hypothetical protein